MSSAACSGVNLLYATFSISVIKIFLNSWLLELALNINPDFFAAGNKRNTLSEDERKITLIKNMISKLHFLDKPYIIDTYILF